MQTGNTCLLCITALVVLSGAAKADIAVQMQAVSDEGIVGSVGVIMISEDVHGLVFTPDLQGLQPGLHGFHLHQNPSCEPAQDEGMQVAAMAAGGHYDPDGSNRHGSPLTGNGHLGDLPALSVDLAGIADMPVQAARLKMDDLHNRALVIHAGGDNYSDEPALLGGGGARVACGTIVRTQ